MKIRSFDKNVDPQEVTATADPFYIWVGRREFVAIERGDTVATIASALKTKLRLSMMRATKLAGYYFSLGERFASRKPTDGWERAVSFNPSRRYAPSSSSSFSSSRPNGQRVRGKRSRSRKG